MALLDSGFSLSLDSPFVLRFKYNREDVAGRRRDVIYDLKAPIGFSDINFTSRRTRDRPERERETI